VDVGTFGGGCQHGKLELHGDRLTGTPNLAGIASGTFSYNADDLLSTESYDPNGHTLATAGESWVIGVHSSIMSPDCPNEDTPVMTG